MGTAIVVIILVLIVIFSVKGSVKHMRGEGGCCGGSAPEKKVKPVKLKNVAATKIISIEGMHCENCSRRIENALNSLEMVNAKVNLEKKQAVVKLGVDRKDDFLKETIEKLGYEVTGIANG